VKRKPSKKKESAKKQNGVAEAAGKKAPFPIVGIGASAGGLEAFTELLEHLPEYTGMAFVLVQHLDPTHGSVLQEILARTTAIPVTEVTDGVTVKPDHIYVIPANSNMIIKNGVLAEIRPNLDLEHLEQVAQRTIDNATVEEKEVRQTGGGWYLMRARPYKTWDNKIDGAVLTFQDVDALKRSLDETRAFADSIIENAREPIVVLDDHLCVLAANRAFYRGFGGSAATTENVSIFEIADGEWDTPMLRELLPTLIKENKRIDDMEVAHELPGKGQRIILVNAHVSKSDHGRQLILLTLEDITERKESVEKITRQSALIGLVHETIIVRDLDGKILSWNRGAEEMYGWKNDEALGRNTRDILKTVFPKPWAEVEAELKRSGTWEGELTQNARDGSIRRVDSRWALLQEEGKVPVILEINSDITELKRSEQELRQLSGRILRLQDEERRRIARELHDSTGQKLSAIKMTLDSLAQGTDGKSKTSKSVTEATRLLDSSIQEIRTLSQLLHPPDLELAGLIPAAQTLTHGFSQRSGIPVEFQAPPDFGRHGQEVELALYRVIQESLTNIHRHAGATKVKVSASRMPDAVAFEISDDGKGMPHTGNGQPLDDETTVGVGIAGMKERLAHLKGSLEISTGSKGTVIRATVPLRNRPA
jgi:PAS domain S-box-containing protein